MLARLIALGRHHLFGICIVTGLAAGTYLPWIHNYFVGDSWWMVERIGEPGWSLLDLLPFRRLQQPLNSTNYYAPVNITVLWFAFRLGGFAPERYHLLMIAFHVGASIALYSTTCSLTGSRLKAIAAGSMFAVHFALTEAVGWYGAMTHPAAGFFGAASLALFARFLATGGRLWFALSLASLSMASLTQVTGLSWFGILLLADLMLAGKHRRVERDVKRAAILVALGLGIVVLQIPTVTLDGVGGYRYQLGPWVLHNLFYYPISTFMPNLELPAYMLVNDLLVAATREDARLQLLGMTTAFNMLLASGVVVVAVLLMWASGKSLLRFCLLAFAAGMAPFVLMNGQGYRYLYVPLMFFSLAVSDMIVDHYNRLRYQSGMAAIAVLAILPLFVSLSFMESQRQMFWWREAGYVTHKTLSQLRELQPEVPNGAILAFIGLPDTLPNSNVQVWRNGIESAARMLYENPTLKVESLAQDDQPTDGRIVFTWQDWQLRKQSP